MEQQTPGNASQVYGKVANALPKANFVKGGNPMKAFTLGSDHRRSEGPVNIKRSEIHDDHEGPPIHTISLIAGSPFENEVLRALLDHRFPNAKIRRFSSISDWDPESSTGDAGEIVLYNLGEQSIADPNVRAALNAFVASVGSRLVVVISHSEEAHDAFDAIDCGAAGYIPANASVEELVEVIRASTKNSVVLPRSSIATLRGIFGDRAQPSPGLERYFTERQLDVAHALRRGAANKTIAYELGLCESTVKVHVRNIMRKLRATNRTQAAFRLNELANGNPEIVVLPDT